MITNFEISHPNKDSRPAVSKLAEESQELLGHLKIIPIRNHGVQEQEQKYIFEPGLGVDVSAPPAAPPSRDAIVSEDGNGKITLSPYPGQHRLADYPAGKGTPEQVEQLKDMLKRAGLAGEIAGELFDQNYNSRADEVQLPKSVTLPFVDPQIGTDVAHWQLHNDPDLYVKESRGAFGARDLRPMTDADTGLLKMPNSFWAVGVNGQNQPVDMFRFDQYGNPLSEFRTTYLDHKVEVEKIDWSDRSNPHFVGKTSYDYDDANRVMNVQHYVPSNNDGALSWISDSAISPLPYYKNAGKAAGTCEERGVASRLDLFDMFGPRLPYHCGW